MTYPKTKRELIQLILKENKDNPDFRWNNNSEDHLIFSWFVTARTGDGLRLTDAGDKAFRDSNLSFYEFPLTNNSLKPADRGTIQKYMLVIDKKMKCPYYIFTKKVDNSAKVYIRVYDHKIAFLISLYGDAASYIESLKQS